MAPMATFLYLLAMVAIIVGVDVRFLRHDLRRRLVANVGIVAVFLTFYVVVLSRP